MDVINSHAAHLIGNSHIKKQYMWHKRNYTDFIKNNVSMKTPIAVARKAQRFPRIPTHLMVAE
jgi:hypothetical protein